MQNRQEALRIWVQSGKKYRNLVLIYTELLEEKKRARIRPLCPVSKSVLREYPKNAFLGKTTLEDAEAYLDSLNGVELQRLLRELERIFTYDHSYVTISARVYDFRQQIKRGKSLRSINDKWI